MQSFQPFESCFLQNTEIFSRLTLDDKSHDPYNYRPVYIKCFQLFKYFSIHIFPMKLQPPQLMSARTFWYGLRPILSSFPLVIEVITLSLLFNP